ncbi:MAG: hypothetical protein PHY09_17460 [Desulfuromonadaceae bacterium]|nr:hypothetical protein [Desulfuromonadaceae bacterium]MDD5107669.1 hypothetical protein [Desulfuromonadaceae bacterium]
MAAKKMNVIIWLLKSAEQDVIRQSCLANLVGLHFDLIYTMPYAMCLNTVSEIFSTLAIEDDKNIVSTSRFSNTGLVSVEEIISLEKMVADLVHVTPINIGIWEDAANSFYELSVRKATDSINKTFTELATLPGNSFSILVVNNDKLPLLELLATPLNKSLDIPAKGELMELRFEGMVGINKTSAQLVYASHHPLK